MSSFQNLPSQLTALLLGWAFTLYLGHRASVRAEALKRKDKVIDRLESLSSWVEDEVRKTHFDPATSEDAYAAMLSQIEIRLGQLNKLCGTEAIAAREIATLRDVDFFSQNLQTIHYQIRDRATGIVEEIEIAFNDLYFERHGLLRRAQALIPELYGVVAALAGLLLLAMLGKAIADL
ncbi:hypothetical protein [Stutzerimonas nitrititolerans]|uniref:hypothetical protein n=1 Tax=Stutzerimonas nitrititolerans TaxID=2482751 RepID=UPI00289EAACD|nr:hypothetical protein [Stutzerimonas nitrititolerans]